MSSPRLKIALAIALSAGFAHLGTVATVGKISMLPSIVPGGQTAVGDIATEQL